MKHTFLTLVMISAFGAFTFAANSTATEPTPMGIFSGGDHKCDDKCKKDKDGKCSEAKSDKKGKKNAKDCCKKGESSCHGKKVNSTETGDGDKNTE